jgi:ABC-2 type transport system permease protein
MAFLNPQTVAEERIKWQLINVVVPIVLLSLFGLGYNYFRRRKYTS